MIKFTLRKKNDDDVSELARTYLLEKINDKSVYKKHKDFIIALVNYYIKHGKFTMTQFRSLGRVFNG
jgi:hypothetical protein